MLDLIVVQHLKQFSYPIVLVNLWGKCKKNDKENTTRYHNFSFREREKNYEHFNSQSQFRIHSYARISTYFEKPKLSTDWFEIPIIQYLAL